MARATNKEELITSAETNFNKLFELINSLNKAQQIESFTFEDRDKNCRDVLIHLYEWHMLLLNWIKANTNGDAKPFLPEPYTWKTYPDMNIKIWKKHQNTSLDDSFILLKQSHKEVITTIESFSNEELFTKKYFPWTGTTNLGSYCISATSSHYDWAIKKIKKHIKSLTN